MAVNAAAPLFLTQALLGPLRAAGRAGRIVIVSSDSGRFSVAKNGVAFPYRMSKAAVYMLTLNLAAALAADGILVNAMHPGWIRTDMGGTGRTRVAGRSCGDGAPPGVPAGWWCQRAVVAGAAANRLVASSVRMVSELATTSLAGVVFTRDSCAGEGDHAVDESERAGGPNRAAP
jgi:NAD(P)-dependent dehydrogenase (short-subunit alcohol dehydrogenase family)